MANDEGRFFFGELNPIAKPQMTPTFDNERSNLFDVMREGSIKSSYGVDSLASSGPFYAIVVKVVKNNGVSSFPPGALSNFIRKVSDSGGEDIALLKCRIPELHAHMPDPFEFSTDDALFHQWAEAHPTFTGKLDGKAEVGQMVLVDFQNRENMSGPILLSLAGGEKVVVGSPSKTSGKRAFNGQQQGGQNANSNIPNKNFKVFSQPTRTTVISIPPRNPNPKSREQMISEMKIGDEEQTREWLNLPDAAEIMQTPEIARKIEELSIEKNGFQEKGLDFARTEIKEFFVEEYDYLVWRLYLRKASKEEKEAAKEQNSLEAKKLAVAQNRDERKRKAEAKLPKIISAILITAEERNKFDRIKIKKEEQPELNNFSKPIGDFETVTVEGGRIAITVRKFLDEVKNQTSIDPNESTYGDHSLGIFSVDLHPKISKNDRQFYEQEKVIQLFQALERAANLTNNRWRAIYNDFEVAQFINRELRKKVVIFKHYHGPEPAVLHIHLDVIPRV